MSGLIFQKEHPYKCISFALDLLIPNVIASGFSPFIWALFISFLDKLILFTAFPFAIVLPRYHFQSHFKMPHRVDSSLGNIEDIVNNVDPFSPSDRKKDVSLRCPWESGWEGSKAFHKHYPFGRIVEKTHRIVPPFKQLICQYNQVGLERPVQLVE